MTEYYVNDIEKITSENDYFRRVLFTSQLQLVVMSLKHMVDIGMEIHHDSDQLIRIEKGSGIAVLNDVPYKIKSGTILVIPAGVKHNVINTSPKKPIKLYTVYVPPEHPIGTVNKNK